MRALPSSITWCGSCRIHPAATSGAVQGTLKTSRPGRSDPSSPACWPQCGTPISNAATPHPTISCGPAHGWTGHCSGWKPGSRSTIRHRSLAFTVRMYLINEVSWVPFYFIRCLMNPCSFAWPVFDITGIICYREFGVGQGGGDSVLPLITFGRKNGFGISLLLIHRTSACGIAEEKEG